MRRIQSSQSLDSRSLQNKKRNKFSKFPIDIDQRQFNSPRKQRQIDLLNQELEIMLIIKDQLKQQVQQKENQRRPQKDIRPTRQLVSFLQEMIKILDQKKLSLNQKRFIKKQRVQYSQQYSQHIRDQQKISQPLGNYHERSPVSAYGQKSFFQSKVYSKQQQIKYFKRVQHKILMKTQRLSNRRQQSLQSLFSVYDNQAIFLNNKIISLEEEKSKIQQTKKFQQKMEVMQSYKRSDIQPEIKLSTLYKTKQVQSSINLQNPKTYSLYSVKNNAHSNAYSSAQYHAEVKSFPFFKSHKQALQTELCSYQKDLQKVEMQLKQITIDARYLFVCSMLQSFKVIEQMHQRKQNQLKKQYQKVLNQLVQEQRVIYTKNQNRRSLNMSNKHTQLQFKIKKITDQIYIQKKQYEATFKDILNFKQQHFNFKIKMGKLEGQAQKIKSQIERVAKKLKKIS